MAVRLRGWPGRSPLGWDVRLPPPLAARASETCACRGGGVCPRPSGRDAGSRWQVCGPAGSPGAGGVTEGLAGPHAGVTEVGGNRSRRPGGNSFLLWFAVSVTGAGSGFEGERTECFFPQEFSESSDDLVWDLKLALNASSRIWNFMDCIH